MACALFALFPSGDVVCVELEKGKVLWQRHLLQPAIAWGHFSSPMIADGKLFMPMIDGSEQSGVYALNPDDGSTIWHAPVEGFSYGSLTLADHRWEATGHWLWRPGLWPGSGNG